MPKVYVLTSSTNLEIGVMLFTTVKLQLDPSSAPGNESRVRYGEPQWWEPCECVFWDILVMYHQTYIFLCVTDQLDVFDFSKLTRAKWMLCPFT